jgi:hypothetical protein
MKILKVKLPASGPVTHYTGYASEGSAKTFYGGVSRAPSKNPLPYWLSDDSFEYLYAVIPDDLYAELTGPVLATPPEWGEYGP